MTTSPPSGPLVQSWRGTTAVRVFGLALAAGQILAVDAAGGSAMSLVMLAALATICCLAELRPHAGRAWLPPVEGMAAALALMLVTGPVGPLAAYLVVPAVVAGIRHGAWLVAVTTSMMGAAVVLVVSLDDGFGTVEGGQVAPWLVMGLGGGLLAAVQTRSLRRLAAAQAPYAAAHHLVGQLHALVDRQDLDLGIGSLCAAMQERLRSETTADRSAVWVRAGDGGPELLAAHGPESPEGERAAGRCLILGRACRVDGWLALPLRVGDEAFGAVVIDLPRPPDRNLVARLLELADEHAVRLDTALLVDSVRSSATSEERQRLAREIHDGVAQRIVALGYLADDVAAVCADPAAREVADSLRDEVGRVAGELRHSVLDLRQDVDGMPGALSEYVRELGRRSDLRVHLLLDERGPRPPRRIEWEVLRIAQEAIANVCQHAHAINLWVSLSADGDRVRLVVEDDGVGGATPRAGHYGLQGMRERAERIDASFAVGPRPDGGTRVALETGAMSGITEEGDGHDHPRLARR